MINKLPLFINPTQSTVYDTESLTLLESIGKNIEKINQCVESFNKLDVDNTNFKKEFKDLVNDLSVFNTNLEEIRFQSQYVTSLAKENQDEINKGKIANVYQINELISKVGSLENNKANIEDIANLTTATPLFSNSVDGMTDKSRIYVNKSDGYIYIYEGNQWKNTNLLYQSTGLNENSVSYMNLSNKNAVSNINPYNKFTNPTFENNHEGWEVVTTNGEVENVVPLDNSFSMGIKFPKTIGGAMLIQRINISKISSGNYIVRCRKLSTGGDFVGRIIIQLSNPSNTTLYELYRSNPLTSNTIEYEFNIDKEQLLHDYPECASLTIIFSQNNPNNDVTIYEPFFGLTSINTSYNNFRLDGLLGETLANKIIALEGDSICEGIANGGGYGILLQNNYKMVVENKGIGGGTIAINTKFDSGITRHWICEGINTLRNDADYVILEGGRNDYALNVPLGELTNGYENTFDKTTFYGALEFMFKTALERFKGKKIGFIMIHKANNEPNLKNKLGLTMTDYYTAIMKTCDKYSIPVCDLYKNSTLITAIETLKNEFTANNGDGLHPNASGYEKYYLPKIVEWIRTL